MALHQGVSEWAERWPQLLRESPMKEWVVGLKKFEFSWETVLRRSDNLINPQINEIMIEGLLDERTGGGTLFSLLERNQRAIPAMPWKMILEHPRVKKSSTRFRLQAMAARAPGASLPDGLDPLGNIKDRIRRTRSGHSATQILIELGKDNGVLLQYLESDMILKLVKLSEIAAPSWPVGTWESMTRLKDVVINGEEKPRLMPEAMRLFFKPHFKSTKPIVRFRAEQPDPLDAWARPPLTPSSELPQIWGQLSVRARLDLMRDIGHQHYTTAKSSLTKEGLEQVFLARKALVSGEKASVYIKDKENRGVSQLIISQEDNRSVAKTEEIGPEVQNAFGKSIREYQKEVKKWFQENQELIEHGYNWRGVHSGPSPEERFMEFLAKNPAWFEIVKQQRALLPALRDSHTILGHVELLDPDGGGISKGVRLKDSVGALMAAWDILYNKTPDISMVERFFPADIVERKINKREAWINLGENQINSGFLEWLAAAPLEGVSGELYNSWYEDSDEAGARTDRVPTKKEVLQAVWKGKDQLTPDLVRRLQNKGEHELFQFINAKLGPRAGMAFLNNPSATLKRMALQQARTESVDPKIVKERASVIEKSTQENGISGISIEEGSGSVRLRWRILSDEMKQIKDAITANPEEFAAAESFVRWFDLSDEFHRRLRDLDRHAELKAAWTKYVKFPEYRIEGYRSKDLLIVPLKDNVALALEGVLQKHCVGTYSESCKNKITSIYAVKNGRGDPIGTLEVDTMSGRIRQLRGFNNRPVEQSVHEKVGDAMEAMSQERRQAEEVAKAYETMEKASERSAKAEEVGVRQMLLAWIDAQWKGGKTAEEIIGGLEKLAEVGELKELKECMVARGSDYVKTEPEANALSTLKAAVVSGAVVGVGVDPARLMMERLESKIKTGGGLKTVLEELQKHLPEEAAEYYEHLYELAKEVAKTDEQKIEIKAAEEAVPSLASGSGLVKAMKTRWTGWTKARVARGGGGRSPAAVAAFIEEMLPEAREAVVRKALGEIGGRNVTTKKNIKTKQAALA